MLHRTARKLTPFGRQLLVDRILIEGWPPATAAEMLGVSRATAYKWLRRYREEGREGLDDRSPRPLRRPGLLALGDGLVDDQYRYSRVATHIKPAQPRVDLQLRNHLGRCQAPSSTARVAISRSISCVLVIDTVPRSKQ